jgi:hypothetical protein
MIIDLHSIRIEFILPGGIRPRISNPVPVKRRIVFIIFTCFSVQLYPIRLAYSTIRYCVRGIRNSVQNAVQ